jgi:hypothetical protein
LIFFLSSSILLGSVCFAIVHAATSRPCIGNIMDHCLLSSTSIS